MLRRLLADHDLDDLGGCLVIVSDTQVRLRQGPAVLPAGRSPRVEVDLCLPDGDVKSADAVKAPARDGRLIMRASGGTQHWAVALS